MPPTIEARRPAPRARPAAGNPSRIRRSPPGPLAGLAPCLLYLFIEFGRPMAWAPALGSIRPGMLAAIWGLAAVFLRAQRAILPPLWLAFGLLAVMAWNVPWAMNNAWALWGFQDFAVLLLGGVLPLALLPRSTAAVRSMLTFLVFVHVPTALWGLFHQGRGIGGWMEDENDLALALNVATGIAFYLFLETRRPLRKLLLVLAIGVMLAAIVSSMSRGGVVGLVALLIFMLVNGPHRRVLIVGIVVVALCFMLFAPAGFWDEVASIGTATHPGDTGEQRFYLWGMAWHMFLDHPLFGVGTLNYGIRAPEYESQHRADTTGFHVWGRVAHSLYFTLLAEQGLVGTLCFLGVVGWCVRAQSRIRRRWAPRLDPAAKRSVLLTTSALVAGIFAVLATGAFLSVLYYPVLWVLVGLLAALAAACRDEAEGVAPPATEPGAVLRPARSPAVTEA